MTLYEGKELVAISNITGNVYRGFYHKENPSDLNFTLIKIDKTEILLNFKEFRLSEIPINKKQNRFNI